MKINYETKGDIAHEEFITREGWPIIIILLMIGAAIWWLFGILAGFLTLIPALFSIYFFRNPKRVIKAADNELVSPADGRIMDVTTVYEEEYFQREMLRIRIFLNLFDVHINRIPAAGQISFIERTGVRFLPAFNDEAGRLNVRNTLIINTMCGEIKVVQITGLIARRLVCWVKPGDHVSTGQRFGMIRFGSCTELYLAKDARILVRAGDKVKGGSSILAVCKIN